MATPAPEPDVIQLLLHDHKKLEAMIGSLDGTAPEEVPARVWSFTNALICHEAAEEMVVYPALRRAPGGEVIAEDRIHEQSEAERAVRNMEKMDAKRVEFADALAVVATSVSSGMRHRRRPRCSRCSNGPCHPTSGRSSVTVTRRPRRSLPRTPIRWRPTRRLGTRSSARSSV
jgi:hypothetical protein